MQFAKLILFAIAIEVMCCIGVLEKKKTKAPDSKIKIERVSIVKENEQKVMTEAPKSTPIQIRIQ